MPTSTDSSYNRSCMPQYVEAIRAYGGEVLELDTSVQRPVLERALSHCQGILLPGSPADVTPSLYGQERGSETAAADVWRETMDRFLLTQAESRETPVLGICYGMQSLNVWRGGSLVQDVRPMPVNHAAGPAVAVAHAIEACPDSLVAHAAAGEPGLGAKNLPVRALVNSSHHQAVGIVGDGLTVSARCPEDGVVEALEGDVTRLGFPALAVQWHPERSAQSALSRRLFLWLLKLAEER